MPGDVERRIRANTLVASPPLVPELRLHLIAEGCPLWIATEADARAAGLDEPYWAFAWPGGQALARYVLDHPGCVKGRRVLDFGSGGAIEGLAALRAGAQSVLAADLDPNAAAAARMNAELNSVRGLETTTENLVGTEPDAEVILAGDVFYDPDLARQGLEWLTGMARSGRTVLIGDPKRGFLDVGTLELVAEYEAPHDGELDLENARRTGVYRPRS